MLHFKKWIILLKILVLQHITSEYCNKMLVSNLHQQFNVIFSKINHGHEWLFTVYCLVTSSGSSMRMLEQVFCGVMPFLTSTNYDQRTDAGIWKPLQQYMICRPFAFPSK